MPILHLMVGLPCSGTSTWAKAMEERTGAFRLTLDEWHLRLFGQDASHPDHDRRHHLVEELMWEAAEAVLRRGGDVNLDFGFWTRSERENAAARAARLAASMRLLCTFPNIVAAVGYAPAFWLLFFAPQMMPTAVA